MAQIITIRGLNRNRIRIGGQTVTSEANTVVNVDDPRVRRDLAHHAAIGSFIVVEALGDLAPDEVPSTS